MTVTGWHEDLISGRGVDCHHIAKVLVLQKVKCFTFYYLVKLRVCDAATGHKRVVMAGRLDVFASEHIWRNNSDIIT